MSNTAVGAVNPRVMHLRVPSAATSELPEYGVIEETDFGVATPSSYSVGAGAGASAGAGAGASDGAGVEGHYDFGSSKSSTSGLSGKLFVHNPNNAESARASIEIATLEVGMSGLTDGVSRGHGYGIEPLQMTGMAALNAVVADAHGRASSNSEDGTVISFVGNSSSSSNNNKSSNEKVDEENEKLWGVVPAVTLLPVCGGSVVSAPVVAAIAAVAFLAVVMLPSILTLPETVTCHADVESYFDILVPAPEVVSVMPPLSCVYYARKRFVVIGSGFLQFEGSPPEIVLDGIPPLTNMTPSRLCTKEESKKKGCPSGRMKPTSYTPEVELGLLTSTVSNGMSPGDVHLGLLIHNDSRRMYSDYGQYGNASNVTLGTVVEVRRRSTRAAPRGSLHGGGRRPFIVLTCAQY